MGNDKHENPSEVAQIVQLVSQMDSENYAILTPYRNQRKLLQEALPLTATEKAQRILTVHTSQGREWDTVILSVSDTTAGWFTNTKNKQSGALQLINTAVSRTKKRLIIVCNETYWQKQEGQLITAIINLQ